MLVAILREITLDIVRSHSKIHILLEYNKNPSKVNCCSELFVNLTFTQCGLRDSVIRIVKLSGTQALRNVSFMC